jgi:predicted nucleotidyltransferase
MTSREVLERMSEHMPEIRQRFGVRELALFGSAARGESQPDSDVDVLADFDGAADFDRFMDLKFYLEELLGKRVDLATRKSLRPELSARIDGEAIHVA